MTTLALKCAEFKSNITAGLLSMLETEQYANVTIAVEGKHLKAHQMVLSICSPYFNSLLQSTPCKHPIIFIKNVKYNIMKQLLRFMYEGQTQIEGEDFELFIDTAQELQVKWLMNNNEQNVATTENTSNDSGSAKQLRETSTEQLTTQSTIDLNNQEPIEPAAPSIAARVAKRRKMSIEEKNTECHATISGSNDIPLDIKQEEAFDIFQQEYEQTSDRIENRNDDLSAISEIASGAGRFFAEPIDKTFDPEVVELEDLPDHVQLEEEVDAGNVVVFDDDNDNDEDGEVLQPKEPIAHSRMQGTTIRSRGSNIIVHDGYTFAKHRLLSDRRQSWRCSNKNCRVYFHTSTDGTQIGLVTNEHNHKKPDIERKRLNGILRKPMMDNLDERPSVIFQRELTEADYCKVNNAKLASVMISMYRARTRRRLSCRPDMCNVPRKSTKKKTKRQSL